MSSRSPSPLKLHPELFASQLQMRSLFLLSIVLRTYFSISPSYIHPDEHFQGPEFMADTILGWNTKKAWEFTSSMPARSYSVAWAIYGIPMTIIELMFGPEVSPAVVLYSLRLLFSLGTWILSDMAIDRLTTSRNHKTAALFFYSSSYVSWTYQAHTFSNSIETVLLLWCLVIVHEFRTKRMGTVARHLDALLLGALVAFGIFNRVTFPAFLLIPGFALIPWLLRHPLTPITAAVGFAAVSVLLIYFDTLFFAVCASQETTLVDTPADTLHQLVDSATQLAHVKKPLVIAPLNNLMYNLNTANLALHGLHSRLQHVLVNLPQLLGPAVLLLVSTRYITSLPFLSAISGTAILSCIQHQEVRFLLPVIPLLCCCLDFTLVKRNKSLYKTFFALWLGFNIIMGVLMGTLHQGGIVPAQVHIAGTLTAAADELPHSNSSIFLWWKTYSPPIWLLGKSVGQVATIDPAVDVPGGGDNVERYAGVFDYLNNLEAQLPIDVKSEFELVKGPSQQLAFSNNKATALTTNATITVVDLMGASSPILLEIVHRLSLYSHLTTTNTSVYLVAPIASFVRNEELASQLKHNELFRINTHLNLDDIDVSDLRSLTPGLAIWKL